MRVLFGKANLVTVAALTLLATGCLTFRPYDPGPGRRVAANVPDASYLPGEPVNVTIANLSEVELVFPDGFCTTELQKKDRGGWVTVPATSSKCPGELGFLEPQQTVVHQFHLPKEIADGTYRLSIPMPVPEEPNAREADLITPTFTIQDRSTRATTLTAGAGSIRPQ